MYEFFAQTAAPRNPNCEENIVELMDNLLRENNTLTKKITLSMQIISKIGMFFPKKAPMHSVPFSNPTLPEFVDHTIADQTATVLNLVNSGRAITSSIKHVCSF